MCQNAPFQGKKKSKNFLERGTAPIPLGRETPHPKPHAGAQIYIRGLG